MCHSFLIIIVAPAMCLIQDAFLPWAQCSWDNQRILNNLDEDKMLTEHEWMNVYAFLPAVFFIFSHMKQCQRKKELHTTQDFQIIQTCNVVTTHILDAYSMHGLASHRAEKQVKIYAYVLNLRYVRPASTNDSEMCLVLSFSVLQWLTHCINPEMHRQV